MEMWHLQFFQTTTGLERRTYFNFGFSLCFDLIPIFMHVRIYWVGGGVRGRTGVYATPLTLARGGGGHFIFSIWKGNILAVTITTIIPLFQGQCVSNSYRTFSTGNSHKIPIRVLLVDFYLCRNMYRKSEFQEELL
jgi:hypothetical protein